MTNFRNCVSSVASAVDTRRRRGFSLLELILALGLTVIVVSAITTAIRLYMFQLQQRQKEIESKQISRGVMRMVASDLRAAIQYKPEDYSGLENLIASQSLSGLGGEIPGLDTEADAEDVDADDLEQTILDAVAAGGGAGGAEQEDGGGDAAGGSEATGDSASGEEGEVEEEEELGRPTLIGDNYFIRTDISRLPRLDEYNPLISRRGEEERLPSDVKTVTYFFSSARPETAEALADDSFGAKGGLYRRQIDRAVEAFQSGEDNVEIVVQPDEYSELISPEISEIQFRYWDGEEWLAEWNSEEQGGFPVAIEVQVVIDPERETEGGSYDDLERLEVETIRTVIHLPVAEVPEEDEDEDEDEGSQ